MKKWICAWCLVSLLACWSGRAEKGEGRAERGKAEAFFPIGIYGVKATSDFAEIKAAGFNLVVGQANRPYLDAAHAAGLKVLASPRTFAGPGFNEKAAAKAVRELDRHPALWAWYLIDEPDFAEVPPEQVQRAQRVLKRLWARKPTALVLYQGYEALDYGNITDILMIDRYPVPWLPLANFGQHVQMARLAIGKDKPLMAVIQAFDWSSCPELLPGEKNFRPPTFAEMRCMTYEALARGANGLFYYAFDDGRWKQREHPETWNALKSIIREVNEKLPLFTAERQWWAKRHEFGTPQQRFNAALQSSVSSCRLRVAHGNGLVPPGDYILAVNNTERELQYSFALPPSQPGHSPLSTLKSQPIEVLGETRSVAVEAGRVQDGFAPYAVHVYGPVP